MRKIYIEAGANNGIFQSRSIHLQNNNDYFGILIEPHKKEYENCVKNRKNDRTKIYNCCLVSFDFKEEEAVLHKHKNFTAMNSMIPSKKQIFTGSVKVKVKTIQSILDENNITHVDNLFLDVEGYELQVLSGVDFDKVTFGNIELENHANLLSENKKESISKYKEFMNKHGYKLIEINEKEGNPKMVFEK